MPRPILATVHTAALRHNLERVRRNALDSRVWAVAVGIGLDDRPHARVGRVAAGHLEIVGECGAVDDGMDRSWHDGEPANRSDNTLVARIGAAMQ